MSKNMHAINIEKTYACELSLVITVMNEEENVKPLIEEITAALPAYDYEIIFVDDGSTDHTKEEIKANANQHIKLVELTRNYGQSTAMAAGIDYAQGRYIALLDGDLQNDPSDIPMMLEKLKNEGWDVVAGNRANRQDGAFLRKIPSKIANALIRHETGVHLKDYGCTLKVFKSEFAKELGLYGEMHRFIPVLVTQLGARITQVDVKHHARKFGKSKYGLGRTMRVASDLLWIVFFQKYMRRPMHLFGGIGIVLTAIGVVINLWLLVEKIIGHDIWGRPLLILGMLLIVAGIQFIMSGLLAEVGMRTYYESQNKKGYKVRNIFDGSQE